MDITQLLSMTNSAPQGKTPAAAPGEAFARVLAQTTESGSAAMPHSVTTKSGHSQASQATELPLAAAAAATPHNLAALADVGTDHEPADPAMILTDTEAHPGAEQLSLADLTATMPEGLAETILTAWTELLETPELATALSETIDPEQLAALQEWLTEAAPFTGDTPLPPVIQQLLQANLQAGDNPTEFLQGQQGRAVLQQPHIQQALAQLSQQLRSGTANPAQPVLHTPTEGSQHQPLTDLPLRSERLTDADSLRTTPTPLASTGLNHGLEQAGGALDAKFSPLLQQPQNQSTPLPGVTPLATGESALPQPGSLAMQPTAQAVADTGAGRSGVPVSPQHPAWGQHLSQQVLSMAVQGDNQLALRLHPAELGPLLVNLQLDEQGAQLQFLSQHGQVRSAVEQALPQLRELLAQQGIELADAEVGAEQHNQHQPQQEAAAANATLNKDNETGEQAPDVVSEQPMRRPGIDLYA